MFRFSLVMLLLLSTLMGHASEGDQEKKQLQQLGKKIHSIQKSIKNSNRELRKLESELEKSERKLAKTNKIITTTNRQIASTETTLQTLQQEKARLEQQSAVLREAIARQIRLGYRIGREPTLKLLLNQEDPALLGRTLRYHHYFLEARSKKLEAFLKVLSELATNQENTSRQLSILKEQQQLLSRQLTSEQQQQQRRGEALAALNRSINTDKQKLARLQLEKQRLETVIAELAEAISNIPTPNTYQPFNTLKGKLNWPVAGKVMKRFGQTRNTKITWDGWLINAKEGASVKSIHSGRVVFADYLRGHGLLIVVDHGDGFMSLYAHNQILLAETGDWINSGSTIAKVGLTGGQQQAGLYFEIRHRGKPANPARWLRKHG